METLLDQIGYLEIHETTDPEILELDKSEFKIEEPTN